MIKLLFMTLGSPSGEEAIDSMPEALNVVSNAIVNTSPTSLGVVAGIDISIFAVAAAYGASSSSIPDQTEKIVESLSNSATSGLNVENFLTSPLPLLKQIGELSTNIPNLPGMSPFPLTRSDSGISGFPPWVPTSPGPLENLPHALTPQGVISPSIDLLPLATHVPIEGIILATTLAPLLIFYEKKHQTKVSSDIKTKIQSIVEHLLALGSFAREAPGTTNEMEHLSYDYLEQLQELFNVDDDDEEWVNVMEESFGSVEFFQNTEEDGANSLGKRTFDEISK